MSHLNHQFARPLKVLVMLATCASAPFANGGECANLCVPDELGRQLIPGGYVALENIPYTADDYRRMVRMGANFQVIRMPIGMIGAWPGKQADEKALVHLDELVRLGKEAGLRTVFKLVVYGQPFGETQWDMLWTNTGYSMHLIAKCRQGCRN
jgi:hypothetical protein